MLAGEGTVSRVSIPSLADLVSDPSKVKDLSSKRFPICGGELAKLDTLKGTPLNLDNFAKRKIRPMLERLGLGWYGFHAFRRGLATKLNQLGVDPKDVQAILRQADFQPR